VVIDVGTGDGVFVYKSARLNPRKLYIGVDANPRPLEKISEKIHRRPQKGGMPNALFVQAAVESLPDELHGVAVEVHVHFPWGSLLRAVATGDSAVLGNLRRICAVGAQLEIVASLDPERDRAEMQRLGLEALSLEYIDFVLSPRYRDAAFAVTKRGILSPRECTRLETAWAKRLSGSDRTVWHILARAVEFA
jgi:16S rRNA (adenine(1408)-N(1))-methyltransferase